MMSIARGLLVIAGVLAILAKLVGLLPTITWMQAWMPLMAWLVLFLLQLGPMIGALALAVIAGIGAALFPGKHNYRSR